MPYAVTDRLYLWFLGEPSTPQLVGELSLVRSPPGVSLRYAPSWLARGIALSEDLPLIAQEFLPAEKGTAAGAVDDARPDRWGERVIRVLDKPPRLSLLEYLYFAGRSLRRARHLDVGRRIFAAAARAPAPDRGSRPDPRADQKGAGQRACAGRAAASHFARRHAGRRTAQGAVEHRRGAVGHQVRRWRTHRHTARRTRLHDARGQSRNPRRSNHRHSP